MPVVRAKYAGIGVSEEFLTLGPSYVKDQKPKKGEVLLQKVMLFQ